MGDPVIADFCATQGTGFLKPLGYPTAMSSIRYAAGCTFRVVDKTNSTRIGVTEYANSPAQAQVRPGGRHTTVHGLRVHVLPLDAGGECVRDVYAAGTVVNVVGYALGAPRTSPKICRAADLAQDDPFSGVREQVNYFGADCYLSSSRLYAYIDVATYKPAAAVDDGAKPVAAGTHTVLARTSNSQDSCVIYAPQEDISDGSGVEMIEFDINAMSSKKPPASMCSRALAPIGRFLDAAGLK